MHLPKLAHALLSACVFLTHVIRSFKFFITKTHKQYIGVCFHQETGPGDTPKPRPGPGWVGHLAPGFKDPTEVPWLPTTSCLI